MFIIVVKQFKSNWSIFLATFLALFLSTILLASFSLLLINSIYAIILGSSSGIKEPEGPIAIFGTLIGITFFIGIFSIYAAINLSVRLRWQQFVLLRILGCTHNKIKLIIFCENLLISIFTIITSLVIAVPLSNGIITFFATLQIKKIEISNLDNFYVNSKWHKTMFQVFFGIVFFAGAIALTVIHQIMIDGMGQGMILCAIFCFIFSFCLLGKYVIAGLLYVFQLIFTHYLIKTTLKSIYASLERVFYPIILLIRPLAIPTWLFKTTPVIYI